MPISRTRLGTVLVMVLSVAGCYYGSTTETPNPSLGSDTIPDTTNPPDRVGRIAYIDGAVSFRPAEADTWAFAELNRTVTTGDRLWVDTVGHAEIEVGPNVVRVGPETEVDAVHIDEDMVQVRVPQGMVNLRVRTFEQGGDYEVDAPNAAISASKAGDYRVDVSADGDTTRVTVHSGQLNVTSAGLTFQVNPQQTATIRGDSATTYDIGPTGPPDAFDEWTLSRDAREDRPSASANYASPEMGGLSDLDDNGSWSDNPDYGPVWYPTGVAVGWAPYSFGQWVWIDPWGWTWVDDEPWGWAPFHYGRWVFAGAAWGWCPGPILYDPIYAPGLVAFVGAPGWAFGVGWFPLAPREAWFPPYRTDIGYRYRINVTNVTNVNEVRDPHPDNVSYRNRFVPGGVSAVPERTFAGGEPVAHALQHPGSSDLATAHVLGTAPGVAPTRASLGTGLGRASAVPPRGLETRPVQALHAPPPAAVPFSAQEHALAANGGRPLSYAERMSLASHTGPSAQTARFRSAAATRPGRSLTPARAGLAPARPANDALFGHGAEAGTGSGGSHSALEDSYHSERTQLEQRHVQEYASPRGESDAQLYQRQELEHRDVQSRYNMARSQGMSRMPASHFGGGGGFHGGGGRPR